MPLRAVRSRWPLTSRRGRTWVCSLMACRGTLLWRRSEHRVTTETKAGKRVDVYSFTQGYSKAARVSRTIGHGAADVFTLGLWEVVGTPTEAAFNGKRVVYEVTYDASDRIESVVVLKK